MCLAAYGRVLDIRGDLATVDFGGVRREVFIAAEEVIVGSYVVVHAGVIISATDKETFEASLRGLLAIAAALEKDIDAVGLRDSISPGGP